MDHAQWNNMILSSLGVLSAIIIITLACKQKTAAARRKLFVFLFLNIAALAFWALYLLAPTVLPLFTERNVDRHFFSWMIPTASFSSLNPFFIITIGPLLSYLWLHLTKNNVNVSTPAKFAVGLVLMGAGYLVLTPGIHFHNAMGLVLMFWLVIAYFFQTVGELFLSPIGLSMVGSLCPREHEGLMMGVWQLTTGISGVFTEYLSRMVDTSKGISPAVTNPLYSHMFSRCGSVTVVVGIITFLMVPWLKRAVAPR